MAVQEQLLVDITALIQLDCQGSGDNWIQTARGAQDSQTSQTAPHSLMPVRVAKMYLAPAYLGRLGLKVQGR